MCSPPLIHISSVFVFSTIDSHLKCMFSTAQVELTEPKVELDEPKVELELTEPKVELELSAPKVEPSDRWVTHMALVHWRKHNWCYSVTGLLSCC